MEKAERLPIRGLNIYVKKIGEGQPLIFLHGGPGGEHRFFLPHLAPLAERFQLIFYDQRGCGLSDACPNGVYTMEEEVETLEQLRVHLGIEKVNLVGESWGSILALLYAAKYPDNVDRLLLTAAVGASVEGFKEFEQELFRRLTDEDRTLLDSTVKRLEKGEAEIKELFQIIDPYYVYSAEVLPRKTKTKSNPDVNRILNQDITSQYDLREDLSKLADIPVLIVQGERDLITPEKISRLLLDYLPNGELVVLEKSGHWTVVEQPEAFMQIAGDFFEKSDAKSYGVILK